MEQSNLYAVQTDPSKRLQLTKHELEQLLGTVIYMTTLHMPRSRLYWAAETRVDKIANIMVRDRWELIKKNVHFNNNALLHDQDPANPNMLFKVQPVIDHLLPKFQSIPQQQVLCVDQQIIPFKGHSSLKQYMAKKSYKWEYKAYLLCDTTEMVHNFEVYIGKILSAEGFPDLGASANIVFRLASIVHPNVSHILCFDNWFTSVPLVVELAKSKIFTLGTICTNRASGCSFSTDNDMRKRGRGAFKEKGASVDGDNVRMVKWYDNRGVQLVSTCCGAQPLSAVSRWDRSKKQSISINCPEVVAMYNRSMGGVDSMDAVISYYRIHMKSKKC